MTEAGLGIVARFVVPLTDAKEDFERWFLGEAVRRSRSIAEAAKSIGVNRTHFYDLLKRYGVEYPRRAHFGSWADQGL